MKAGYQRTVEYLRSRLWTIPATGVLVAFVLSRITLGLDARLESDRSKFYLFPGGPDSAQSLLSSIASSMITFTAVVFSVTILVLQLAANQLSPRVMRTFLRDWLTQLLLGASIATFIFSLLVLREVSPGTGQVPAFSTWTSLMLTLATVSIFISYISHMTQSIRASTIIENVASETRETIQRLYPDVFRGRPAEAGTEPPGEARIVESGRTGIVTSIDENRLAKIARDNDLVIALVPRVGDFVAQTAPLLRVWGKADDALLDRIQDALTFGKDRTMQQDAQFGLRQLVDIAERALSPGINDPTTAIQALNHVYDILRLLARSEIPSAMRYDDDGHLRLVLPRPDWGDYVALGLDEIRQYGVNSEPVITRMHDVLHELLSATPASRQPPVYRQLGLLESAHARVPADVAGC